MPPISSCNQELLDSQTISLMDDNAETNLTFPSEDSFTRLLDIVLSLSQGTQDSKPRTESDELKPKASNLFSLALPPALIFSLSRVLSDVNTRITVGTDPLALVVPRVLHHLRPWRTLPAEERTTERLLVALTADLAGIVNEKKGRENDQQRLRIKWLGQVSDAGDDVLPPKALLELDKNPSADSPSPSPVKKPERSRLHSGKHKSEESGALIQRYETDSIRDSAVKYRSGCSACRLPRHKPNAVFSDRMHSPTCEEFNHIIESTIPKIKTGEHEITSKFNIAILDNPQQEDPASVSLCVKNQSQCQDQENIPPLPHIVPSSHANTKKSRDAPIAIPKYSKQRKYPSSKKIITAQGHSSDASSKLPATESRTKMIPKASLRGSADIRTIGPRLGSTSSKSSANVIQSTIGISALQPTMTKTVSKPPVLTTSVSSGRPSTRHPRSVAHPSHLPTTKDVTKAAVIPLGKRNVGQ